MSPPPKRAVVTPGDVLLILAGASLLAAVAYPRVERALMHRQADRAQADVEAIQGAVAAFRKERTGWPASAATGAVPEDIARYLPRGFSFRAPAYSLKWDRWEALEAPPPESAELPPEDPQGMTPPPPPDSLAALPPVVTYGAITVQAPDERILAALMERFGPSRSFVRDASWTLLLPPGEGP